MTTTTTQPNIAGNADLLVALQQGLPITRRPFAALGDRAGMTEADVIAGVQRLFDDGQARRLGAVFDLHRLGYRSTLCAVDVPPDAVQDVVPELVRHPGITHCYERGWPAELARDSGCAGEERSVPNIWFTLAVRTAVFDSDLEALRERLKPYQLLSLPSIQRFKVSVVFDPRRQQRRESGVCPGAPLCGDSGGFVPRFNEREKRAIRLLQGNLPLTEALFDSVADQAGYDADELIAEMQAWDKRGILRRVGIILHHRKAGFKANGMCVWNVPDGHATTAGRTLTAFPEVTHCYQRETVPGFDYNLYAMIHGTDWEETIGMFHRLSRAAGLHEGRILFSLREFKKTSPRYFCEDKAGAGD